MRTATTRTQHEEWVHAQIDALRDLFFRYRTSDMTDKREYELLHLFRKGFYLNQQHRFEAYTGDDCTQLFEANFKLYIDTLDLS